jgi:hypothetical protein
MVNHRVELEPPELLGARGPGPVLLERTDRRFMQNVLAEIGDPARHDEVRASLVQSRKDGGYHLYQPVHRVFHLAVIGAVCADVSGRPRIDPARIDSAGLVVRKTKDGRGRDLGELGWLVAKDGSSRWEPPDLWDPHERQAVTQLGGRSSALTYADPDPKRRPQRSTGRSDLDERIAVLKRRGSARSEAVTPMFPISPAACTAAGETLLLGLVPTASRETEQAPEHELPDREELEAGGFFPPLLTVAGSEHSVPLARQLLDVTVVRDESFADYADFVREMVISFEIQGTGPASVRLRGLLQQIPLSFRTSATSEITVRSAYEHLVEAAHVLVDGDRTRSFRMPERWGVITAPQEAALKDAMLGAAQARFAGLALDRARFGDRDASYVVRAYIRVRRDDGCAPELVWSAASPEFKIAPWYDSSPGPRPTIDLPSPFDIGAIKPNVTFAVPPVLSNLLGNNAPEDLLDGKGGPPSGIGIMWLCSFSIPIITICAFLLLNIFIKLLNFVFWWMPFVKICIPIPKPK